MSNSVSVEDVFGNSIAWSNYSRLSRLLISGGTRVLRELFDFFIPPENLANTLEKNPHILRMKMRRIITTYECQLLFPPSGSHVSSDYWNFSLLFKLLRNVCDLPPPPTGWDRLPSISDMSLSADLVRLRHYRNMIDHQVGDITDEKFKGMWEEIKNTLLRIVHSYAPSSQVAWEKAIDELLTTPLSDGDQSEEEKTKEDVLIPFPVKAEGYSLEAEAGAEAATTKPPEILASSSEALEAYKEALTRGKTKNRRVLVTVVGPPRAGKTSLLKSLKGEDFDASEDSTTGVVIQKGFCIPQDSFWLEEDDSKNDLLNNRIAECMTQNLENNQTREGKLVAETATNYQAVADHHANQQGLEHEEPEIGESVKESTSGLQESIFNELAQPIPKEIQYLLEKRIRDKTGGQRTNENEISLKTLDFAGQQIYEVILPLFISSKSIYILVHSLENDLRSDAQPKVKHGNSERKLKNPFKMTYLDAQEFWLSCISSYTNLKKEVDSVDYRTQVALPPVFVVCTHADVCNQDPKKVARELCEFLTRPENPYGKHVVPNVYTVDNKLSGNKEVQDESAKRLKTDVEELSKLLPQVNEDIPVSWLRFEEELSRLVEKEQKKYVDLEEAMRIATQCNVNTATESIEFTTLLNYLHDLKTIIYFEETRTVFIDTQWLVDMFVKVITVMPFEEWKEYAAYWRKLENDGILKRALVEHVWSDIASDGQNTVDSLLLIMEKFSLICPWRLNEEQVYLVPCMLCNSKGTKDIEMLLADQKSSTMVIRFESVHLPMGIFPRLLVALAEHGKKEWPKVSQGNKECLPKLRPNVCRMYNVGQEGKLDICITSGVRTICVTVYNKNNIDGASVTKFCQSVRKLLDKIFAAMENTCPRVENMALEYGIRCPVCTKSKMKCSSHKTKGCKRDSCQHFVSEEELKLDGAECHEDESNLDTLIREEAYSHWFPKPNKRSHVQVETQQLETNSHGNGATELKRIRKCRTDSSEQRSTELKRIRKCRTDSSEQRSTAKGLEDCKVISESKNVTIDVEGGFHNLSSFGVLLQVPPNAVTHPTVITCRKISPDRIRLPTEENETLVSNCVRFESNSQVELQKPIIVTLAHSGPSKKEGYETIVKELRDSWEQKKEIREDIPLAREHFNSAYIRVEIMIKGCTALAVVTRLLTDTFEVTEKGCFVRSSVCEDVTLEFPEGAVDKTYIGSLKLLMMPDHIDILDGMVAYPCPIIFIDGFDGVNFAIPVKIKLPHPYPEGYPTGNVRLLTMDAPHEWKDITNEVRCVETESFIELQVSHFSCLWAWKYKSPLTVATSLSRYLFKAPQEVCFAVFKKTEECSNVLFTLTLVCVSSHKKFKITAKMKDEGYTILALSTGNKNMRPGDKAYTKVKGCYKKMLDEGIFLRFIKNDIFIKELPLVKKSEIEETSVDNATGIVLVISFLEKKDGDSKDNLCTFCIEETRIVPPEPSKKLSSTEASLVQKVETVELKSAPPGPSGLCSSETEDRPSKRTSASEAASCKELEVCFKDKSLAAIDTNEAASKVADLLNLDKYSMDNPPEEIVVRCREFCSYMKSNERDDIVKKIRDLLPSGMTGPLCDARLLVKNMDFNLKQRMSRALSATDKWKAFAEKVGVTSHDIAYYDEREKNPVLVILDEHCGNMTVDELYFYIVESGANAIADDFL